MHIICVHFSTQSNWHSQDVVWFSLYVGRGVTILVGSTKLDWPKTYNRSTIRWKEILGNQYQLLLAGWGWIDLSNWKYISVLTISYVYFSSAQIKIGRGRHLAMDVLKTERRSPTKPNQSRYKQTKKWILRARKWESKVIFKSVHSRVTPVGRFNTKQMEFTAIMST